MQAVALSLKADHYYFNNNLDSLKAWIPRVQDFARKNDQIKYYYFTWSRLILYYTKQAQYTLAQYELEQYMSQAEKDNYKPATAEAYKQLGHIYRTRGLKKPAVEYYRKAIDFIIQNGLNTFHLSNLYSELATMLMDLQRYPEAAEAVEKGKACIPLPDYIWGLKAKRKRTCSPRQARPTKPKHFSTRSRTGRTATSRRSNSLKSRSPSTTIRTNTAR